MQAANQVNSVLRAQSTAPRELPPEGPLLLIGSAASWDARGLEQVLKRAGWAWMTATDIARARWLTSIRPVAAVLIDGDRVFRWQAIRTIRELTTAPLAVVADDPDEVIALVAAGVDLAIPSSEPCDAQLARIRAVIRTADVQRGFGIRYLRARDLVVDLWTRGCTLRGAPLALSPTEYRLLVFLMTHPTMTLSASSIVSRVWQSAPRNGRNALGIVVNRLRSKLGDSSRNPAYVATIRCAGFRFVATVIEVGDSAMEQVRNVDVTPFLDSLRVLVEQLGETTGQRAAADVLVDVIGAVGLADRCAVFRRDGTRMRLVTARGVSETWLAAVAHGVPLDPSFASACSVLTGEIVQFAESRHVRAQFEATARLADESSRAQHFVPIITAGGTWGHVGLSRRSPSPMDTMSIAYLKAACAVFAQHLGLIEPLSSTRAPSTLSPFPS